MLLMLPLARPFGLAARMTADQHAEINEISAAVEPVLDRLTCPVRNVLATGGNFGGAMRRWK